MGAKHARPTLCDVILRLRQNITHNGIFRDVSFQISGRDLRKIMLWDFCREGNVILTKYVGTLFDHFWLQVAKQHLWRESQRLCSWV